MAFSVQEAVANLNREGFAKPAHYEVIITGPGTSPDVIGMPEIQGDLLFRTDSVTIPGRGALTTDTLTYGPTQSMAYGSQYPRVEMTIMLSPSMKERIFFERWQDIAVGHIRQSNSQLDNGINGFNIGYYTDYIGTVLIVCYDAAGRKAYNIQLIEAWPSTISGINMNWNDDADVVKLLIGWSYRYYVDQSIDHNDSALLPTVPAQPSLGGQNLPNFSRASIEGASRTLAGTSSSNYRHYGEYRVGASGTSAGQSLIRSGAVIPIDE